MNFAVRRHLFQQPDAGHFGPHGNRQTRTNSIAVAYLPGESGKPGLDVGDYLFHVTATRLNDILTIG